MQGMRVSDDTCRGWTGMMRVARCLMFALVWLILLPSAAWAQSTTTIVNPTDGTINGSTRCSGTPLVRDFVVSSSFTIGDVNLGIYVTHTWRGDLRMTLQAPDGTRVQLVDGNANTISGDNFNVLLDDSATQVVNTDSATGNHSTTAPPPFERTYSPNNALSAFNGKASAGTWRLEICDLYPNADNGVFRHAELYLTGVPSTVADLSLVKTVNNTTPANGQQVTYTLVVTNASYSPQTAAATVTEQLPAGVTYVSHSGYGTYDQSTGIWTLASIAPGQTRTLTIVAQVSATSGATITNSAEIATSNRPDTDSTPGNGAIGEDDYSSATFTVSGTRTAGIAPTLVCPNGTLVFDWAGRSWPAGSTTNNYTLAGFGAFNWSIVNPGTWLNIAALGGQQPALTTGAQSQTTLSKGIDFANPSQIAVTTVTLGEIVDGAQFVIFDVDYAANDFADLVRVTGYLGSNAIIPVLTNGVSNYVIGNAAYGDAGSDAASADGNVTVTFNQPIDRIEIEYGNHSLAPADPDGQAIQMKGSISICAPVADLVVSKSSVIVSDPVLGIASGAFAIPGALMKYCITITNNGSATADAVSAIDVLPTNLSYQPGSLKSGATCAAATTSEDDDATGADESDPAGASFAAGQISLQVNSLQSTEETAFTYEATID